MATAVFPAALPQILAQDLAAAAREARYIPRDQRIAENYREKMHFNSPDLPSKDEVYTARFGRTKDAKALQLASVAAEMHLRPLLEQAAGRKLGRIDARLHRMGAGDHFRAHLDDNLGTMGFSLSLTKGWRWDWGGLLVVPGEGRAFLSRFNELVVMDGSAHLVTEIAPHAREPRYTLVGFAA